MPSSGPLTTGHGNLTRLGFQEPEPALVHLAALGEAADPLVAFLARTADPDLALLTLTRLVDALREQGGDAEADRLLRTLVDDEGTAMRLLTVLGASEALG